MAGKRQSKKKAANGEGSIRRRPNGGLWEARLTAEDGRRLSHYATTRIEAAAWLTRQKRNRDQGLPLTVDEKTPLSTYLDDWLIRVAPTIRSSTHRRYRELAAHLSEQIGRVRLAQLTPAHLERAYATLQRPKDAGGAGLSASTVHHTHAVIHKALEDAVHEGVLVRNVASIARPPRLDDFEPTIWMPPEVQTFLHAAVRDRLGMLYIVVACTGMRSGELRGLRWQDVDLDAKVLRLRSALDRAGVASSPKTKGSRRPVELPMLAVSALRAQRTRQAEERLALGEAWGNGGGDRGLVFTTTIGTPLDGVNLLKAFYRFCDSAGLPRIRIHDLRHLQASLLLAAGIHPKVVAERLGHAGTKLTMDTYSHVMPTLQREAADVLDRLLGDWESLLQQAPLADPQTQAQAKGHQRQGSSDN